MHYGHCYLIQEAKKRASAEAVVCVMSGNYVQRGVPAILDKWSRTEIALENGADLIVEIPTAHCLGNAAVFASAGVRLLESIGLVTHIAFGSESGNLQALRKYAEICNLHSLEIEKRIRKSIGEGRSYPAAREQAILEVAGADSTTNFSLHNPNDILGLEYLRNLHTLEPIVISRKGAGYHEDGRGVAEDDKFQSSTSIRKRIEEGKLDSSVVPWNGKKYSFTEERESWIDLIRYQIMNVSPEQLDEYPGGGEGLGYRLQKVARDATSIEELIEGTKSKRYTYTRISRWLFQILLGIDRDLQRREPDYIRVLGFTEKGREIIRKSKKNELNSLPFIVNINKCQVSSPLLTTDLHGVDVYNLLAGRSLRRDSDYCRRLIMK